ncbi:MULTISPECIES: YojF family protein [Bacillus]|uniref:YojF family protein n=1 Tax=Bacillus TaxID=1386 RepID=UPI000BB917D4|nr:MULTISPECIES: YojF family protein [Bacillus]
MQEINKTAVQEALNNFANAPMFLHLETTNGAYATHNKTGLTVGAFIRNNELTYENGKITGNGPFRIGLKLKHGWVYAEGITHYEIDDHDRLLLAGLNHEGKLAVALQLSPTPF